MNLAVDVLIQVKMVKRDIINHLMSMIDRGSDLSILVLQFLLKLSVYKENKDQMKQEEFIEKLSTLLPLKQPSALAMSLCYNLSFDPECRLLMVKHGVLQTCIEKFGHNSDEIALLYQFSIDDKHRSLFAPVIPTLFRRILECRESSVPVSYMALAINLSMSDEIKAVFDQGLGFLIKRALKTNDVLLWKLVRNSISDPSKLLEYIDAMMDTFQIAIPNIQVEILGILNQLAISRLDFCKLAAPLLSTFNHVLSQSDIVESDDLALETIIFLGVACLDSQFPAWIQNSRLIPLLCKLITNKQDEEMILQGLYFHVKVLMYLPATAEQVQLFLDFSHHENKLIRQQSELGLDKILETPDFESKIINARFAWHNAEWLGLVTQANDYDSSDEDAEYDVGGESRALLYYDQSMAN